MIKAEFDACNSLIFIFINIIRNATKKAELEACAALADNFKSGLIQGVLPYKRNHKAVDIFRNISIACRKVSLRNR